MAGCLLQGTWFLSSVHLLTPGIIILPPLLYAQTSDFSLSGAMTSEQAKYGCLVNLGIHRVSAVKMNFQDLGGVVHLATA